jgi:hypothetical protein
MKIDISRDRGCDAIEPELESLVRQRSNSFVSSILKELNRLKARASIRCIIDVTWHVDLPIFVANMAGPPIADSSESAETQLDLHGILNIKVIHTLR